MNYMISKIKSKADAMAFAIEKCGDDLGKAEKIYRMFVDNMELPDTEQEPGNTFYAQATEAMKTLAVAFKENAIQSSITSNRELINSTARINL